jgi:hypothetical protein
MSRVKLWSAVGDVPLHCEEALERPAHSSITAPPKTGRPPREVWKP